MPSRRLLLLEGTPASRPLGVCSRGEALCRCFLSSIAQGLRAGGDSSLCCDDPGDSPRWAPITSAYDRKLPESGTGPLRLTLQGVPHVRQAPSNASPHARLNRRRQRSTRRHIRDKCSHVFLSHNSLLSSLTFPESPSPILFLLILDPKI